MFYCITTMENIVVRKEKTAIAYLRRLDNVSFLFTDNYIFHSRNVIKRVTSVEFQWSPPPTLSLFSGRHSKECIQGMSLTLDSRTEEITTITLFSGVSL